MVGDPHHHVLPNIGIGDFGRGVIGKNAQSPLQARDVLRPIIDEKVDVLGEAARAVNDDREAADEDVAGAGVVQRPADADEVFRLRSA